MPNCCVRRRTQAQEARERLRRLKSAPDLSTEKAVLEAAQDREKRASAEVATASKEVGVVVPYCEVLFVPQLPATVVAVHDVKDAGKADEFATGGGNTASAPEGWATVAAGPLMVQATVPNADARLLKVGTVVEVHDDQSGDTWSGRISRLTARDNNVVLLVSTATPFDVARRGTAVRVTAKTARTNGKVLAVPVAAVRGSADGGARVTVLEQNETRRDVPVRTGLEADGFVEVHATDPQSALSAGDQVVVSG